MSSDDSPASAIRERIFWGESFGPGVRPSGAGATAGGRPEKNARRAPPGQSERPTAPASCMLR